MTLNDAMRASSTGLAAERFRMNIIAGNIANAHSVRTEGQDAFRRRMVHLQGDPSGVRIMGAVPDMSPLRAVQEPDHPFADANGYVHYSNVQPLQEMVDMIGATRAYEANIAAFNSARSMVRMALMIGEV